MKFSMKNGCHLICSLLWGRSKKGNKSTIPCLRTEAFNDRLQWMRRAAGLREGVNLAPEAFVWSRVPKNEDGDPKGSKSCPFLMYCDAHKKGVRLPLFGCHFDSLETCHS